MTVKNKTRFQSSRGFSVVELAFVIIASGVIILPVFYILTSVASVQNSQNRMEMVMSGLAEHMRVYGRLPCPADISLDADDTNYTLEDCSIPATTTNTVTPSGVAAAGVMIGAVPVTNLIDAMDCGEEIGGLTPSASELRQQGLFKRNLQKIKDVVSGAVDADGNALQNYRLDKTACVTLDHMVDTKNNKILYAVTRNATSLTTFNAHNTALGEIAIEDQSGNRMTRDGQLFVLVSHGDDMKGAFTYQGSLAAAACGTEPGIDNENCDGDGTFISVQNREQIGVNYYDDTVDFSIAGLLREDNFLSWSQGAATDTPVEGNTTFNPNVKRMVIDQMANPAATSMNDTDKIVVNQGDLLVEPDAAGIGGNIDTDVTIRAQNNLSASDVEAANQVQAVKFCYDPPLSADCMVVP